GDLGRRGLGGRRQGRLAGREQRRAVERDHQAALLFLPAGDLLEALHRRRQALLGFLPSGALLLELRLSCCQLGFLPLERLRLVAQLVALFGQRLAHLGQPLLIAPQLVGGALGGGLGLPAQLILHFLVLLVVGLELSLRLRLARRRDRELGLALGDVRHALFLER